MNDKVLTLELDSQFYDSVPDFIPIPPWARTICYRGYFNVTIAIDKKKPQQYYNITGPWSHSQTWVIRYQQEVAPATNVSCFYDHRNHTQIIWTNPPSSQYATFVYSTVAVIAFVYMIVAIVAFRKAPILIVKYVLY
eukprot:gene15516-18428_t